MRQRPTEGGPYLVTADEIADLLGGSPVAHIGHQNARARARGQARARHGKRGRTGRQNAQVRLPSFAAAKRARRYVLRRRSAHPKRPGAERPRVHKVHPPTTARTKGVSATQSNAQTT